MKTFEGSLVASNIKVAIVAARFNEFITSKLIGGAMDGLSRHGVQEAASHYDYVCAEVSKGIATVSLQAQIPVLFGVLTTDTIEQAIERAGTKAGNKGYDCALSAVEMVNLIREIEA